jgi:hypothetical protein
VVLEIANFRHDQEGKKMSEVAIKHSPNVADGIQGALDLLGDMSDLFRDIYVAIKPDDTWASAEDITACTQADSVAAVIQYVTRYYPSHGGKDRAR